MRNGRRVNTFLTFPWSSLRMVETFGVISLEFLISAPHFHWGRSCHVIHPVVGRGFLSVAWDGGSGFLVLIRILRAHSPVRHGGPARKSPVCFFFIVNDSVILFVRPRVVDSVPSPRFRGGGAAANLGKRAIDFFLSADNCTFFDFMNPVFAKNFFPACFRHYSVCSRKKNGKLLKQLEELIVGLVA